MIKEKIEVMKEVLGDSSSWIIQLERFENEPLVFESMYRIMVGTALDMLYNEKNAIENKIQKLEKTLDTF